MSLGAIWNKPAYYFLLDEFSPKTKAEERVYKTLVPEGNQFKKK